MQEKYYDVQQARNTLEQLAAENEGTEDRRLAAVTQTPDWARDVIIKCVEGPQTWRLLKAGKEEGNAEAMEEMIFTVRGILCAVDLPPLLDKPAIVPARFKYLRQGVTIAGLGSPTFQAAMTSARDIYDMFSRQFPEGKLEHWHTAKHMGLDALEMSNRYFTPKRDAPSMEHIPFGDAVDPRGILEAMAGPGYVHGEENVVEYYVRSVDDQGNKRYDESVPQSYRLGDIVEIQSSFIVVPLKGQSFKMLTILRSIALLDSQYSREMLNRRMSQTNIQRTTVKRRVGYGVSDGETSSGSKKRAMMEID